MSTPTKTSPTREPDADDAPRRLLSRRTLVRLRPRRRHLPYLVLGLGMVAQFAVGVWAADGGWFGVDALHYFTRRGPVPELDEGIWGPYAGHWQPALMSVFLLLFSIFGLNYWPFVLFSLLVHLANTTLVVMILRTLRVSPWLAVLVGWLLLFFGAGGEAYISDAPVALTAALMLGLIALLVCLRAETWSPRRIAVVAVLLLLSVMTSATGVVMLVLLGAYLAAVRWRLAIVTVGPPALVFLVWFAVVGRTGDRVRGESWQYLAVPRIVWKGITEALGNFVGIPSAGPAVLLLVVVVLLGFGSGDRGLRLVAWAGALGAVTQMTLSAMANLAAGTDITIVGRYQYVMIVLLCPALALVFTSALDALRRAPAAVPAALPVLVILALVVSATVSGLAELRRNHYFFAALGERYQAWVYGTAAAVDAGERPIWFDIEDPFAQGRDVVAFTRPELRDKVPLDEVTELQRLTAESQLFVGVRQGDGFGVTGPALVNLTAGFATSRLAGSGCHFYTASGEQPEMEIAVGEGVELEVSSPSSQVTTELVRDDLSGGLRIWGLTPGQETSIASTAKDALLVLRFNAPGQYEICTGS